jgi:hypothetical protein
MVKTSGIVGRSEFPMVLALPRIERKSLKKFFIATRDLVGLLSTSMVKNGVMG